MQEKGSSHIHTYDTLMHGLKVSLSEHVPYHCVNLSHAGALGLAVSRNYAAASEHGWVQNSKIKNQV